MHIFWCFQARIQMTQSVLSHSLRWLLIILSALSVCTCLRCLSWKILSVLLTIVSAWLMIPPSNAQPNNFFCPPQVMKILTSLPRETKSPDNVGTFNMVNNNTFTNFKTAYRHMLILQWCHAREIFGSQIPVATGGFELWISCIRRSYLTHEAIRSIRLGGFRVPEYKRFAVQTFLWALEVVNQIILKHDTITVWKPAWSWSISASQFLVTLFKWFNRHKTSQS